mgnify:CR=1 FL=1
MSILPALIGISIHEKKCYYLIWVPSESGPLIINYGIESMDQKVLNNMKKGLRPEMIIRGIEDTVKVGISPGLNFIFGNKGDNKETIKSTVDFMLKYDDFAQCVTDSGAKMYGAYWCSHCNQQKESLGDSFYKINYVECSLPNNGGQTKICKDEGVESYPTWEFGDEIRMSGFVPLEKLAERTGCELPE